MRREVLRTALALESTTASANAYDLDDKLSVGGVLAGAGQCQEVANANTTDTCKAGFPIQPEVAFRPVDAGQLLVKLGFAAGNGLNKDSPFLNSPWAAHLEDDVNDINGRGRYYLLTAW